MGLVGAHFDRVDTGLGVADNWSGAALLPSFYQALLSSGRHHTFAFVGFADEGKGLIGSEFYASRISKEQAAKIRAMINLDTLGLSSTKIWVPLPKV